MRIEDVNNEATAMSSYAGKINQSGISVPMAHAAAGNTGYMDAYMLANQLGFEISEAPLSGVIPAQQNNYYDPIGRNRVTGEFGESRSYYKAGTGHQGTDIALSMGQSIIAPFAGKVTNVGFDPNGYGNYADITDSSGLFTARMAHAQSFGVKKGQAIYAGQSIGAVGSTGRSTGPHLHYEVTYKGQRINPRQAKQLYSSTVGKKTYGITFSLHGNNYSKLIDQDTGMMSITGMNKIMKMINESNSYGGNVQYISTNRPELLEDKPEYSDYKAFRSMKGADGKPLFRKGEGDKLTVVMKREGGGFNTNAIPALAEDGSRTSTDVLPPVSSTQNRALLEVFQDRGTEYKIGKPFGLADLTADEYEEYGVSADALENPVLQNRVLVQEFQRASEILGTERKAVYALAGGSFRDMQGKVKTWKEIKADKDAFMKDWFLRPEPDTSLRKKINNAVAEYDKISHREEI